ncbi:MAG: PQQ-binding-like beta-propeller repeat protein, partial [Abitibacteriaceae bacterium]|nr:PQQ-binding-like beta-propeller repeat protein [Abditibacteriaceae bacterium]
MKIKVKMGLGKQGHQRFVLALCLLLLSSTIAAAQVSVLTQRYDNGRSGANLAETTLNTSNVNVFSFGKLFTRPVDGQIYAQPLCVANVAIPNQGTHNVVYVATEHNSVYAFDADDPNASAPLWQVNLGPSIPSSSIDCGSYCPYHDIIPEVGITGTPVIDPSSQTLYVVAKTLEGTAYFNRLHALDITTGQEKFGGPVVVQPTAPGSGDSSA